MATTNQVSFHKTLQDMQKGCKRLSQHYKEVFSKTQNEADKAASQIYALFSEDFAVLSKNYHAILRSE